MRMIWIKSLLLAAVLLAGLAGPSLAVNPDEMLADPALEARAREISKGLRCVVCRNQNIDDSNAGIARDMRIVLRERLTAGDSNDEARDYIVNRYGQYVLLKPPVTPTTLLLWAGPSILLLLAIAGFSRFFRRSDPGSGTGDELTGEDKMLVERILATEGEHKQ